MSLLKREAEAIKGVAGGVEHIQKIAKAERDGGEYLKVKHPETCSELSSMCAGMRNTFTAIAAASAIR